jgi:hypothetical protein
LRNLLPPYPLQKSKFCAEKMVQIYGRTRTGAVSTPIGIRHAQDMPEELLLPCEKPGEIHSHSEPSPSCTSGHSYQF